MMMLEPHPTNLPALQKSFSSSSSGCNRVQAQTSLGTYLRNWAVDAAEAALELELAVEVAVGLSSPPLPWVVPQLAWLPLLSFRWVVPVPVLLLLSSHPFWLPRPSCRLPSFPQLVVVPRPQVSSLPTSSTQDPHVQVSSSFNLQL